MHRRPEEAPYFCSLCGFKAFTWDALTKHVETFAMHRRKIRELGVQVPSSEYLKEGQSQGIEEGVDYNICSQEESQEIWGARPKRRCKTVTSTQESIQQLEGLIPEDLLQQVMTHCGIISSPTFSEMASPGVTLDEEPSYAMPSSTTAPVCSSTAPVCSSTAAVCPPSTAPVFSTAAIPTASTSTMPPTSTSATSDFFLDESLFTSPVKKHNVIQLEENQLQKIISETVTSTVLALRGILAPRIQIPSDLHNLLIGVSNQLTITNQNLLDLARCIDIGKPLNKLVMEAREIKNAVNDSRADFQQSQLQQHTKGPEQAIRAVVDTLGQVQSSLTEQSKQFQEMTTAIRSLASSNHQKPSSLLSSFDFEQLDRITHQLENVEPPKKIITLEERKALRELNRKK